MKKSLTEILDIEAEEAEAHADAVERGEAVPSPGQRGRRQSKDPAQVYAVRIPVSRLEELRLLADELGEQPTGLIRRWVLENLDAAKAKRQTKKRKPA